MARDLIGLYGIVCEDEGEPVPLPYSAKQCAEDGEIMNLVDVDFEEYRALNDDRLVRKYCTIPSSLDYLGRKAGINFSGLLTDALKERFAPMRRLTKDKDMV